MKLIKGLLIVLLALTVVFTFGQSALAEFGSQTGSGGEGGIQVDPNAPGTKYVGPLTIYYTDAIDCNGNPTLGHYDLSFFIRLRKGYELYAYSGTASCVPGSTTDVVNPLTGETELGIQSEIEAFVRNTVIPNIYNSCNPLNDCPPVALKSVDLFVDDETSACCDGMIYSIMDITIAVQD